MSRDALIVGISTYEVLDSLQTPADDAEAVAQLLAQYGDFNVTRLPGVADKTIKPLHVGRKTKVTQRQLKEALVQLFKPTGKHLPDAALFYFSGHGTREDLGISQGFLATSDTHPDLDHWGLSLKWLRELLQDSPIKQQIIWLDCCYSGELLNFEEANPLDQGKARDRCFIAASREFEVAYEGIASSHSVFTEVLLQALDPTHHPEGLITNLTLVDLISRSLQQSIQRPLHTNVGSPIILTRRQRELSVAPPTTPSEVCPYKGLLYFDCNDVDPSYFFGREKLTDQLLEQVREHSFIAVLGVSGSGKSSLVRAGLLYQLQQGRKLSGSETWPQLIIRPGDKPLQSLAFAFVEDHLSVVERAQQAQQAEELMARGAKGFQQLVRAKAGQERLVILIDQFEEVFTRCQQETERQAFFTCLLENLEALGKQVCVVLTMRADFFGECAEYDGLIQCIKTHLFTVSPMDSTELRQAIERPAQLVQLTVKPELVETLVKEVAGSPGHLPLLEYTLWLLWQQGHHCLSLTDYVHLGGINGALQQRADEVYTSLTKEEQVTAKAIFLELTQLGEGTEDTRKQVFKQDLITPRHTEALVEETLQKLVNERLIVTDSLQLRGKAEQVVTVVDVAHEALIRHWSVLRGWIQENREFKAWRDKLRQAEREWQAQQQDEGLLLRGAKLLEAQEQEKVYREWLTEREVKFIAESVALKEKEIEEKERSRKELERSLKVALVRQLIVQSILALKPPDSFNGYFDRALLLAVQAFKEQNNLETRGALRRVMKSVDENHPFAYLHGHRDTVTSVAFSPDGQTLASGSGDQTIILWEVNPQSWQRRACRIAGRNLTRQEWQDSVGSETYQKTCPEYPSGEALAMIEEGRELAKKAEPQDIKAAIAKFKEAFALDASLKEHPLYRFDPETKAKEIAASALVKEGESLAGEEKLEKAIATFKRAQELDASLTFDPREKANKLLVSTLVNKGESLAGEEKLEEAIAVFKRAQELGVGIKENERLAILLPFFSWLVDPKKDWKEVLTAIEQHPNLTIKWDFFSLELAIQRQKPPERQRMAQNFIDFLTKKIDLATLKEKLSK